MQVVTDHPTVLLDRETTAEEALNVFELRHARELYGQLISGYDVDAEARPPTLTITVDRLPEPPEVDVDGLVASARREVEAVGRDDWRVVVSARASQHVRARVPVPPLGWTTVAPTDDAPTWTPLAPARREGTRLSNGLIDVGVADDGTLSVSGDGVRLDGVGRLVDGGDAGDTYNYGPPPQDELVDTPERVEVRPVHDGPLAAAVEILRTFAWPTGLTEDRRARAGTRAITTVRTAVEVRADEPFVRLRIGFDNAARDHRLRWHAPLPEPDQRTRAEGQFAVVARGLHCEGGHGEHPLPTAPAHGFVATGGLALLLDHVSEYELVDGEELALTLLRATSHVSVNDHPYRAEPAGPQLPTPMNQCQGPWEVGFAVRPTADPDDVGAIAADAERYRLPFLQRPGTAPGAGTHTAGAGGLDLAGEGVALSALRRRDGGREARLVNLAAEARTATLTGPFERSRTLSLLGSPLDEPTTVADGRLTLRLEPHEIRTVWLGD
ncbi:glycoside hydrolase family 38 C-terminal domain-containing protein [Egibacter rhizosphaerae]|uniref:glycoside hydrolase family 38 C-terminal domain-containing protein n=1 Tax=Egibacter rhizosphaerae TaxID=1670831 RepID=UPI0013F14C8B